jgi:hypothetical protein
MLTLPPSTDAGKILHLKGVEERASVRGVEGMSYSFFDPQPIGGKFITLYCELAAKIPNGRSINLSILSLVANLIL